MTDKTIRRILTRVELDAIHDAAQAADSPQQLLHTVLSILYDALLAGTGRRIADQGAADTLDPAGFTIPASQWRAITALATGRASVWGVGAELGLDLANLMPSTFEMPDAPQPSDPPVDHRPDPVEIRISRAAADVIRACETHLDALSHRYGPQSRIHLDAERSWRALSTVWYAAIGSPVDVRADGPLDLLITAPGLTIEVVFHAALRRCTAPGCHAHLGDDGTVRALATGLDVIDHHHEPSYPLGAPRPGTWSMHT